MSEKVKGIFGNPERANEIREWFKSQGAKSSNGYTYNDTDLIYYIRADGFVTWVNQRLADLFDIVELSKLPHEFKPFDRVLVRDGDDRSWRCAFFSHMQGVLYCCIDTVWKECIPFEGNEHLLDTTDSPEK